MNIQPADYLVHLSNLLLLVSYSVRDMLWLRWFAVAAALTVVPYYLMQNEVLWPPILWGGVFTAINLAQIARIYLERRPVVLSSDEQKLYDLGFRSLRPREFVSLVLVGDWHDAKPGDTVIEEGQAVSNVCIAIEGTAEVSARGSRIGTFSPGSVMGTALALSGNPSPLSATFSEPGRYICWPLQHLREFLDRRPELRTALQALVNRDLAGKLEGMVAHARAGSEA